MKTFKIVIFALGLFTFSNSYSQEIDEKQKKKFEKVDANSDGAIDAKELATSLEGKTNKDGEAFNADRIFKNKDANDDGKLSLEEYTAKPKNKNKK